MLCMGPSIKYVTLFLANFYPLSTCHTLSHISGPPKYVTYLGPPPRCFSKPIKKILTKAPVQILSQLFAGFLSGRVCQRVFGLEGFVRGGFCPILLLSQYMYICYNRKLNITLNFMFNMYDKKCISVTSHALDPLPPVTNCHTYSDPLPLERDVLYGRPL